MLKKSKLILALFLCALVPCAGACSPSVDDLKRSGGGYTFIGETLFNVTESDDGFYVRLVGMIKNVSEDDWTDCTISFKLYGIDGADLCLVSVSVGALKYGQAQLFKASPVSPLNVSPSAFKLASVEYKV